MCRRNIASSLLLFSQAGLRAAVQFSKFLLEIELHRSGATDVRVKEEGAALADTVMQVAMQAAMQALQAMQSVMQAMQALQVVQALQAMQAMQATQTKECVIIAMSNHEVVRFQQHKGFIRGVVFRSLDQSYGHGIEGSATA